MLLSTKETSQKPSTYECIFPGEPLKKQSSPILKGDHPELDDSEFMSEEDKAKYMSMIGTAQWLVTLGRFDITITVSTLSSYRVSDCMGTLNISPMLLFIFKLIFLITAKWYMNPQLDALYLWR